MYYAYTWNGTEDIDNKSLKCFWQTSDESSFKHICHKPKRPAFSESKSPTHSIRKVKQIYIYKELILWAKIQMPFIYIK